jgi:hypothetical protein
MAMAAQQAAAAEEVTNRDSAHDDDDDDGNEPRYCYCDQVSYGEMVACDADGCKREWFHLGCVGPKNAPKGNGKSSSLGNRHLTPIQLLTCGLQRNGTAKIVRRNSGWGARRSALDEMDC